MAAAGVGGVSQGNWLNSVSQKAPVPPGYHGPPMEWSGDGYKARTAPPGYTWDEVKGEWVHSPTQQGQAVNEFNTAANPSLASLLSSITSGGGAPAANGGAPNAAPGSSSGSASSVGTNGFGTSGVSGGNRLPTLQMPDQTNATNAAFATAKDKVGKTSRASLDSLRGELGATGMLGSGAEGQLTRDVITSGAGELGQVSRDQAGKQADLAADFAKTNFAGGITQRGQDVSASEAAARLAQEQRLADASLSFQKQQAASQQQLQMLQLALGSLKGGGSASGLVY